MFDIRACRGCLSTKGKLEKITGMTKKMYVAVTGLEIDSCDGMPTNFCHECHTNIKRLLSFRRRCRRAYYVMKEIISVNKQLTLNNIMMVNRKRTNLQSPYSFNKWQNVSYFTIDTVQPDIDTLIASLDKYEPEEKTTDLIKQNVDTRSIVFHIDIQPTQEISIPEPIEETPVPKCIDSIEDVTIHDAVAMDIDVCHPEEPAMDAEKVSSDDESDDAINTKEISLKKKPKKNYLSKNILESCAILAETKIRVLSMKEQRQAFKKRLEEGEFKTAKYKCSICVVILESLDQLLQHIKIHKKSNAFTVICKVCKLKFKSDDYLASHTSVTHLYEYKCKKCDEPPLYTLNDIITHHKAEHPNPDDRKEPLNRMERMTDKFVVTQCTQEEMQLRRFLPTSEHECNECGMKYVHANMLGKHVSKHSVPVNVNMDSVVQCDICGIYYKSYSSFYNHMRIMHMYTYQCKQCPTLAYNLQEAEHHLNTHEALQLSYLCEFCDKQLKTEKELMNHRHTNHYTETHTHHCNLCGDSHTSEELLYQHQVVTHETISIHDPSSGDKECFCQVCHFQFTTLNAYKSHAIRHEHDDAKTFENVCYQCVKVFDTVDELAAHNQTSCKKIYKIKYPVKCPYCDEIMHTGKQYYRHQKREHNSQTYRPVGYSKLCEQCGQSVASDLKEHMKRHNAPEEQVPGDDRITECVHCYPVCRLKGVRRYASHVVRVHVRRPYMCTLCPATFSWCSECWDHIMKTHSPALPYTCEICDKQFSHGQFLEEHTMYVHKNEIKVPRPDFKYSMKLWVYPHMKLNLSLLDPTVLPDIRIEMWDYSHEKKEILEDFTDYVVLDSPEVPMKKTTKKRKAKQRKEKGERKKRVARKVEGKRKVQSKVRKRKPVVKVTEVVECLDNLKVMELDGENYVNINGILYKIQP